MTEALDVRVAACTEVGRRSRNEDRIRVVAEGERRLAIVADGAGGHRGGAEASRRADEALERALVDLPGSSPATPPREIREFASRAMLDERTSGGQPMGSLSAPAIAARKVFLAKIKPGADDAIRKNQDMLKSVQAAIFGLDALIEKAQIAPIELHITNVKALTAKVAASIVALDNCLAKVKDFAKENKSVLAELDEASKLNAGLADERHKATTRIAALKSSQSEAEKALKNLAGSRTELNAQWALIEADARKAHQEVLAEVKKLYEYRDKARAAAKSKDAKALADARSKAEMMANPYLSEWPGKMKKKLSDFASRYEKEARMNETVLGQLARDKAELNGMLERVSLNARLIESVKGEIADQK